MLKSRVGVLLVAMIMLSAVSAYASQCVKCHTDVEVLKAVAKTLPKPVVSAETAGKG